MNILKEADDIINNRSQEKDRQYGPFNESMEKMATIFNSLTGLNLTAIEMFKAMIALKLSRESYCHKEDGLLDLVGYIGAMNNYMNYKNIVIDDDLPF
jgi:hypothetical protein